LIGYCRAATTVLAVAGGHEQLHLLPGSVLVWLQDGDRIANAALAPPCRSKATLLLRWRR
jgi:hypothetical protein